MLNIIIGLVLIGLAYQSASPYDNVLFVQGMILLNYGIITLGKKGSIERL